jgi:hypothetical protein
MARKPPLSATVTSVSPRTLMLVKQPLLNVFCSTQCKPQNR